MTLIKTEIFLHTFVFICSLCYFPCQFFIRHPFSVNFTHTHNPVFPRRFSLTEAVWVTFYCKRIHYFQRDDCTLTPGRCVLPAPVSFRPVELSQDAGGVKKLRYLPPPCGASCHWWKKKMAARSSSPKLRENWQKKKKSPDQQPNWSCFWADTTTTRGSVDADDVSLGAHQEGKVRRR